MDSAEAHIRSAAHALEVPLHQTREYRSLDLEGGFGWSDDARSYRRMLGVNRLGFLENRTILDTRRCSRIPLQSWTRVELRSLDRSPKTQYPRARESCRATIIYRSITAHGTSFLQTAYKVKTTLRCRDCNYPWLDWSIKSKVFQSGAIMADLGAE
jgi:hypothetical protein